MKNLCRPVCLLALWLGMTTGAFTSEIILTAENLNATLKQMQRLQQQMENAEPSVRAQFLFDSAVLAADLADVLSEEVALYDSQQGGLIQLALDRTRELGYELSWVADKQRFVYDGKAFAEYLKLAPDGAEAAESTFRLLQNEFVSGDGDDPAALQSAVEGKLVFLQKYPADERAAEVALLLAIDYRDLSRLYRSAADADKELRYRELTLAGFRQVAEAYPDTRQARVASGLLARFESELDQNTGGEK